MKCTKITTLKNNKTEANEIEREGETRRVIGGVETGVAKGFGRRVKERGK